MNRREFVAGAGAIAAAAMLPGFAEAQAKFPDRPIKLLVPFAAGGVNDVVGRQWADRMRTPLGTVYVENQGGAAGTIGALDVLRSAPDGYSLFLGSTSTLVLNPMTAAKPAYDPNRFDPISVLCVSTTAIVVHPSVPAKNLQEFIAHVKANPGKMSYGSAGTGTMSHLAGELFKQKAGIQDLTHISYKGAGPGITDLVSGHILAMSPNITGQLLQLHQSGKIRILAMNAPQRLAAAPDVPTAIEQGLPDMVGQLFLGIFAPGGTPQPVIDQISKATAAALQDQGYHKALDDSGFEIVKDPSPAYATKLIAEENKRWAPVVKAIGLKMG